jgi:hypothetical protein
MKSLKFLFCITFFLLILHSGCSTASYEQTYIFGATKDQSKQELAIIDWSSTHNELAQGVAIYRDSVREYTTSQKVYLPPGDYKIIIRWLARSGNLQNTVTLKNDGEEHEIMLTVKPGMRYVLNRRGFGNGEQITVDEKKIK